jgi:trans-2,3-dihydro-3-hydroxyanthranilate isomerase
MKLHFVTVDVFTGTQFAGNPLGVVLNAEGLSGGQMQAIAAEFNLAETTFVLPPKDPANTAEVRIFTPRYEMPFAGHPNVGTAFALARAGKSYGRAVDGERVIFEEKAGLVPISILKDGSTVTGARLASQQRLSVGAEVSLELIASACSLSVDNIETQHHRPCIASCGAPFVLAELRGRAALAEATARSDIFLREVSQQPATSILIYTHVSESGLDIRARISRRIMASPKIRRPAAQMLRSSGFSLTCGRSGICNCRRRSRKASRWAAPVFCKPKPRRKTASSPQPISADAACPSCRGRSI